MADISKIADFGQGSDENIIDILKALNQMSQAYYTLVDMGDDWWTQFNQTTDFEGAMKDHWTVLESIGLIDHIESMQKLALGEYLRYSETVELIESVYNGKIKKK